MIAQVVTIKDVDHVIKIMGTTAEMQEGKTLKRKPLSKKEPNAYSVIQRTKSLGVWLVEWLPISTSMLCGSGCISYYSPSSCVRPAGLDCLSAAVSMARTTAEKLEMKGEKVNIDTIERIRKRRAARLRPKP
ncbi:MAG: hypothetical protein U5L09_00610, partial [Bacteroidales bacterium]|nr:hypothetical protein [Bacteroidales bacterium]